LPGLVLHLLFLYSTGTWVCLGQQQIKKLFSVYLLGCKGRFPEPIFGYFSAHSAAMR